MRGENTIVLNRITLIEAIQRYIDQWGQNVEVLKLSINNTSGAVTITVKEKKATAVVAGTTLPKGQKEAFEAAARETAFFDGGLNDDQK